MSKYFLTSARLGFRKFRPYDLENLVALFSDPDVMKHYPSTYTREKTINWLNRTFERYETDQQAIWAVELLSSGEFIGGMGLPIQVVENKKMTEIGYILHRKYWRQGYASEGAAALKDYAFTVLNKPEVISLIDPANEGSAKVAQKIGMQLTRHFEFNGRSHQVYSLKRD